MRDTSFTETVKTSADPSDIISKIGNVSEWWAKDFQGTSKNVGDNFVVKFSSGDTFAIKVSEIIPEQKVVWDITDAFQGWVKEPKEWVGTRIEWDIKAENGVSEVTFTHVGLVPQLECFGTCSKVWDYLMQKSFSDLLNTGKGLPA